MEKIVVENVYKIFGPHPERAIELLEQGRTKDEIMDQIRLGVGVADVSFTVNEGEILVVMGLSGSGKSTLVRCINRLIEPTQGKIWLNGEDVLRLSDAELRQFRQNLLKMWACQKSFGWKMS
jgi:glycine betaine/proline transport system ATP-binding protein